MSTEVDMAYVPPHARSKAFMKSLKNRNSVPGANAQFPSQSLVRLRFSEGLFCWDGLPSDVRVTEDDGSLPEDWAKANWEKGVDQVERLLSFDGSPETLLSWFTLATQQDPEAVLRFPSPEDSDEWGPDTMVVLHVLLGKHTRHLTRKSIARRYGRRVWVHLKTRAAYKIKGTKEQRRLARNIYLMQDEPRSVPKHDVLGMVISGVYSDEVRKLHVQLLATEEDQMVDFDAIYEELAEFASDPNAVEIIFPLVNAGDRRRVHYKCIELGLNHKSAGKKHTYQRKLHGTDC